jgi:multidrug resistance efflux pump
MALTIEEAEKLYLATRKEHDNAEHEAEEAKHAMAEAKGKMHKTRGFLVALKRQADTAEERLVQVQTAGVEAAVKLVDTLCHPPESEVRGSRANLIAGRRK